MSYRPILGPPFPDVKKKSKKGLPKIPVEKNKIVPLKVGKTISNPPMLKGK